MNLARRYIVVPRDVDLMLAAIRNAGWLVRCYRRGSKEKRRQALLRMGVTVREAFLKSDDYEKLLQAVVDGLRPKEDDPPF